VERQIAFYVDGCGMEMTEGSLEHAYLRGKGGRHHVIELVRDLPGLRHVAFEVEDDGELDRAVAILKTHGLPVTFGPASDVEPDIRRLLRFCDPEQNTIELASGITVKPASDGQPDYAPIGLNHTLLYAGDLPAQQAFYERLFGMRVSDTVLGLMTFLRCSPNHHSFGFIALPKRGLHHLSLDLSNQAELSEAIFHLGDQGYRLLDGPGRHGPGNMLFVYFEDPDGNVVEWNTEIQQVDEAIHVPKCWDPGPALNLWQAPEHMVPPKGLEWMLNVIPAVSKLLRSRPLRSPLDNQAC
jgi:catechol 2,3-dioxygenase-like lactoylglutathione lyase family enzyme